MFFSLKRLAVLSAAILFQFSSLLGQISSSLQFSLKSGPFFVVDANNCGKAAPTANFIAVEVYNSSLTTTVNVGTLTLDSFPTGWQIKGPLGGENRVGVLLPGQRKTVYYYLRARCASTGTAVRFRFKAQNNTNFQYYRPIINLEGVISAASASGLASKLSAARVLGGYVLDTVEYTFGGFNAGAHMIFTPTSQSSFKYNSLKLESMEVISAASALGVTSGTKDILYFTAGSGSQGNNNYTLTALFRWRIVGLNDTIVIAPYVCNQQGGTNIKGITSDTTLATGKKIIIPISANSISVSKTCNVSRYTPGDTVTYSIKLTNSSVTDIVVDEIRDTLPTGLSFVRIASGSDFTSNMLSLMPSGGATGALSFLAGVTNNSTGVTSMTVPGNSSRTLQIRVFIPASTTGALLNKSSAFVGTVRLDTGNINILEFGDPVLTAVSTTNPTCNGGNNGQIKLTANAAVRPFTWSKDGTNYVSDSVFSGLTAGTYNMYVKSNTGKISTISVTLTQPVATSISGTLNACVGATNTLTGSGTAATSNPWVSSTTAVATVNSSGVVSGVSAGTSVITYTDNNGCTASQTVTIKAKPTISGTANACLGLTTTLTGSGTAATSNPWVSATTSVATVNSSGVVTGVSAGTSVITYTNNDGCSENQTVTINALPTIGVSPSSATILSGNSQTLTASGGSTYSWSPSTGLSSTSGTTVSASPTTTTTYNVTGTDANGCTSTGSTTITVTSLTGGTIAGAQTICSGGNPTAFTSTVDATGGSGSLTLQWQESTNSGGLWTDISGANSSTYDVPSGLTTTTFYRRKVTDASSNVEYSNTIIVTVNANPTPSNTSQTNVLCFGNSTGSVTVAGAGGTSPYEYKIGTGSYGTSATFSSLASGSYTVTVKDANGCTADLAVSITQPTAALSIATPSITDVSCKGGSTGAVNLTVSGGTMNYTYSWSGPSSYTATTEDITSLSAGTYSVTVTDANTCTASNTSIAVSEPSAALSVTATGTDVTCKGLNNGSITATVSGGNTTFSYSWSGPSSYNATTKDISGLSPGNYTLTVTDNKGCTASSSAVTIAEPSAISVTNISSTDITCNGAKDGTITITATGGGTLKYSIDNGSTYHPSNAFTGLDPATYTVKVTDNNNCAATYTPSQTVVLTQPNAITVSSIASTNITCNGAKDGTITITATGGGTLKYSIDNGANYQSSNAFTGLDPASYTVKVTDNNNCAATYTPSQTVVLTQPDKAVVSDIKITPVTCFGAKDGKIEFTATGGNSFTYSIDNGNNYQSSNIFTGLDTGSYTALVMDVNGCTIDYSAVNTSIQIINGDNQKPTIKVNNLAVYLDANGQGQISYSQVDNGSFDNCGISKFELSDSLFVCSNRGLNKLFVTVSDLNSNWDTAQFVVEVLDTISPEAKGKDVTVYLDNNGDATITTADVEDGSTDNCQIELSNLDITKFDCSHTKTTNTVKYTVIDSSGNSSYDLINVTVIDSIVPKITVTTAIVYLDTAAKGSIVNATLVTSTSDNCEVVDTLLSQYTFTKNDTGWVDIDITITDVNGNITKTKSKVLVLFADSDNDSIPDYIEGSEDTDGDGVYDYLDLDSDNDGILDVQENEGLDYLLDLDSDGTPDYKDLDTDGDGINDVREVNGSDPDGDGIVGSGPINVDSNGVPVDANGGYKEIDTDSDNKFDYKDLDSDDDGIPDSVEKGSDGNNPLDTDNDGTPDYRDLDSDNDGIPDTVEKGSDGNNPLDTDNDGTPDYRELDSDGDGIPDTVEKGSDGNNPLDTDGDGTPDYRDLDSDNDGIPDSVEKGSDGNNPLDTDGDGTPDYLELDSDNDGISDRIEAGNDLNNPVDTDGDGIPDFRDLDSDNDETLDSDETYGDADGNGIPDNLDPQVFIPEGFSPNGDGVNDVFYIKGLKNYPKAKLTIFNRWGQIVYESPLGYQNDWNGEYNGNTPTIQQGPLPENVYYLLFEYNGSGGPQFMKKPVRGNIYIKN